MKFVIALIKLLGIILLSALFCAFVYYTFISPQVSPQLPFLNAGKISLILFVLAAVVFALLSVGAEGMLSKNKNEAAIKLITDKLKQFNNTNISSEDATLNGKLSLLLEQLNSSGSDTNKTLNLGIQQLNDRIDQLQNISSAKNDKLSSFSNSLDMIAAEITATLNSLKDGNRGAETDLSPLTNRLNSMEDSLNNLSEHTLQTLSQLRDTVSRQSEPIVDLAPIAEKISNINDGIELAQRQTAHDIDSLKDEVNDIKQRQSDILTQLNAIQEAIDAWSYQEEEEAPADNRSPVADFEEPEPIVEETFEPEPEPVVEEAFEPEPEPVVEEQTSESYDNQATESEQMLQADNPFGVQVEHSALSAVPVDPGTDPSEYSSDTPFGTPTEENLTQDLPDLASDINPNELASDDPFGTPIEAENIVEAPEIPSFEATNPFGAPVDLDTPVDFSTPIDLDAPADFDNTDALQTQTAEQPTDDSDMRQNLNKIFNDQLASDLASLDIMHDDAPAMGNTDNQEDYDEVDLSALLGEDNSDSAK